MEIKDLPKKIKIGYFTVKINYVHDLHDENGNLLIGLSTIDTATIDINIDFPDQIIKETLLHEIMHFLLSDTALFPEEMVNLEEEVIRVLSPKTMAVLTINKKLTKFLLSKNTGGKYVTKEDRKDTKENGDNTKNKEREGINKEESGEGSQERS